MPVSIPSPPISSISATKEKRLAGRRLEEGCDLLSKGFEVRVPEVVELLASARAAGSSVTRIVARR